MPDRFSEAQEALDTILLTLLGVSAVIVIVLAGLMMPDMGEAQRSQGGVYYVGFFALFVLVLGAIFSKFLTVMVRRRDRRRRTTSEQASDTAPRSGDIKPERRSSELRSGAVLHGVLMNL